MKVWWNGREYEVKTIRLDGYQETVAANSVVTKEAIAYWKPERKVLVLRGICKWVMPFGAQSMSLAAYAILSDIPSIDWATKVPNPKWLFALVFEGNTQNQGYKGEYENFEVNRIVEQDEAYYLSINLENKESSSHLVGVNWILLEYIELE